MPLKYGNYCFLCDSRFAFSDLVVIDLNITCADCGNKENKKVKLCKGCASYCYEADKGKYLVTLKNDFCDFDIEDDD